MENATLSPMKPEVNCGVCNDASNNPNNKDEARVTEAGCQQLSQLPETACTTCCDFKAVKEEENATATKTEEIAGSAVVEQSEANEQGTATTAVAENA